MAIPTTDNIRNTSSCLFYLILLFTIPVKGDPPPLVYTSCVAEMDSAKQFFDVSKYDEALTAFYKTSEVLNGSSLMQEVVPSEKEDDWLIMGNMYNEQKKYEKAIEAFTILGDNPKLSTLDKLRARMGLARAMYGLQYFTDAKIHYLEVMSIINEVDKVPASKSISNMSPYDVDQYKIMHDELYNEAKKRVEEIAAKGR